MEDKKKRAFALEYGTILGIAWTAVFAAYVYGLRTWNALLLLGCYAGMILIALLPFILVRRYRRVHTAADETISFGNAIHFCFLMFSYAILLTGICQYIYFAYMDGGAMIQAFKDFMNNPENIAAMQMMGTSDLKMMMEQSIETLATLSPLDITLSLFQMNITVSLFMIFLTAFAMKKEK